MQDKHLQKIVKCTIGKNTVLTRFINLYGCTIGDGCMIGTFVEIQKGAQVGNRVRVQSHSFICEGVTIEDDVFIGHGVVFINDNYPRANKEWEFMPTLVKRGVSIGSNATILGGITIGENAMIGAGSVVTKDVPGDTVVAGNPAKVVRSIDK